MWGKGGGGQGEKSWDPFQPGVGRWVGNQSSLSSPGQYGPEKPKTKRSPKTKPYIPLTVPVGR